MLAGKSNRLRITTNRITVKAPSWLAVTCEFRVLCGPMGVMSSEREQGPAHNGVFHQGRPFVNEIASLG